MRRTQLALVAAMAISGGVAMTGAPALAADPLGQITEYSIPTAGSFPTEDITGPDGNIWFTENRANKIGRVTTSGSFTEFPLLNSNSQPLAIAAGQDGNLWFTESQGNRIGRISTAGTIAEFDVTTMNSAPDDITAGPDSNLWFSESAANNIARITPAGVITEFAVPTGAGLMAGSGVGAGPDGNVWFTEGSGNKIGRITPTGGITEFSLPTGNSRPNKIEPGPDGHMWFTEFNADKIGRIDVAAPNTITEFSVPTASAGPNDLRAGADGNIWFTEFTFGIDKVAQITMSGLITEFKVPTADSQPGGIAPGPDGNMWFTEDNASKIAKIGTQSGFPSGSMLFASDHRRDVMDVGDDTDNVPHNMSFPYVPCAAAAVGANQGPPFVQSGCRSWDFQMFNQGASNITGAQVAIDSSTTGLALNDASEFNFTSSTVQPGPGNPPPSTACPAPSLHQETCPVPGATIPGSGGLQVNSSRNPQAGVPIVPAMTTGYDSARQVSPPVNGIAAVTVPLTLRDGARFGGQNSSNRIGLSTFNSNIVPGSATVTKSNGAALPPCPPFGSPPQAPVTCADPPQYVACANTFCHQGQVCTAVFLAVNLAQLDETYSFNFRQYVGNSDNPATGNCGSVKTPLGIDASPMTAPSVGGTPCCSSTLNDPTLGNVTFSIDPGQTATIQSRLSADYVVQYGGEAQLQVMTPLHPIEGQSINGQVGGFVEPQDIAPSAADYTATIDWGDGTSSPGVITGPDPGGFFAVSGSHQYGDEGGGPPTISVTDLDTPWNTGTASGDRVRDAPLFAQTGQTFGAIFPFSDARVATFHDANPAATCADFNGRDPGPNGSTPGSISVVWDGLTTTSGGCSSNGGGNFTVTTSNPSAQLGPHTVTVRIVDDGGQSAMATNTVFVGAFPANGSFVVGNLADTGTVIFWGATWSQANPMSGGPAPGAFKGFESSTVHPTACGGDWTSGPGNSAGPPATIPRWMAAIVSSSVTGSGSAITGNLSGIVIVDTNGSAYAPNPGATGTAIVVASVCP